MSTLRCPECGHKVGPHDAVCQQCGYRFRLDRFERVLPFMRRPEKPWERRLTLRQRFWAVLVIPAVAFWDIVREPDNLGPFLIFFGNMVSVSLFYIVLILHVLGVNTLALLFGYVGTLAFYALLYLIWSMIYFGIINTIVNLSGRKGLFSATFLLGQYAQLPLLIANIISLGLVHVLLPYTPISILYLTYPFQPIWLVVWGLTAIASLWGAILLSLGLRERYQMTTSSAFVISFSVTLFAVIAGLLVRVSIPPLI